MFGQQQQPSAFGIQPQPSPFGAQQQPSLFGSQSKPAGASLFGGSSAQGTSMFGAPTQGTSMFGTAAPAQGTSMFGAPTQGTSMFGTAAPAPTTSVFGGAPASTTSVFGGAPTTSMFGTAAAAPTTSVFGGAPAQNTSAFGGAQNTSLFGGGQQQQSSVFGGVPSSGTTLFASNSAFAQPSNTMFCGVGSQQFTQQQQSAFPHQQQQQQPQSAMDQAVRHAEISGPSWYRELVGVQAAYRLCRYNKFQSLLYEIIPPLPSALSKVKQDRQRIFFLNLPWLDEREWQRMEDNNPDPEQWNPTPVIGIDMLAHRVRKQTENSTSQLEQNLEWIENCQQNLQVIRERVEAAKRKYSALHSTLIANLGRLERLQARTSCPGPRTPQEVGFKKQLEELRERISHPSNGLFAKVLQLDAQLLSLSSKTSSSLILSSTLKEEQEADKEADKRNALMLVFLQEQTKSLSALMDVLRRDAKEVKLIKARMFA
ncbi:hypothetical protein BASA81_001321 [Batrachochytrium salamandrivorans]|nr:hypothetical protein BASA81_001321 [Batrachochytrium salamandrivorans]